MGAVVRISPELENLVRSTPDGFVVESQGLPNLIHELVHALEVGRLADDHDFPYCEIPLKPQDVGHRRLLWDELACCLLSCAVLPPAQRDDWFAEQLEIQGVFYGLEDRPMAFVELVEGLLEAHSAEFEAFVKQAQTRLTLQLGRYAAPDVLDAIDWPEFRQLWRAYRERTLAAA